jgi:hypothetical protein
MRIPATAEDRSTRGDVEFRVVGRHGVSRVRAASTRRTHSGRREGHRAMCLFKTDGGYEVFLEAAESFAAS